MDRRGRAGCLARGVPGSGVNRWAWTRHPRRASCSARARVASCSRRPRTGTRGSRPRRERSRGRGRGRRRPGRRRRYAPARAGRARGRCPTARQSGPGCSRRTSRTSSRASSVTNSGRTSLGKVPNQTVAPSRASAPSRRRTFSSRGVRPSEPYTNALGVTNRTSGRARAASTQASIERCRIPPGKSRGVWQYRAGVRAPARALDIALPAGEREGTRRAGPCGRPARAPVGRGRPGNGSRRARLDRVEEAGESPLALADNDVVRGAGDLLPAGRGVRPARNRDAAGPGHLRDQARGVRDVQRVAGDVVSRARRAVEEAPLPLEGRGQGRLRVRGPPAPPEVHAHNRPPEPMVGV